MFKPHTHGKLIQLSIYARKDGSDKSANKTE